MEYYKNFDPDKVTMRDRVELMVIEKRLAKTFFSILEPDEDNVEDLKRVLTETEFGLLPAKTRRFIFILNKPWAGLYNVIEYLSMLNKMKCLSLLLDYVPRQYYQDIFLDWRRTLRHLRPIKEWLADKLFSLLTLPEDNVEDLERLLAEINFGALSIDTRRYIAAEYKPENRGGFNIMDSLLMQNKQKCLHLLFEYVVPHLNLECILPHLNLHGGRHVSSLALIGANHDIFRYWRLGDKLFSIILRTPEDNKSELLRVMGGPHFQNLADDAWSYILQGYKINGCTLVDYALIRNKKECYKLLSKTCEIAGGREFLISGGVRGSFGEHSGQSPGTSDGSGIQPGIKTGVTGQPR